MGNEASWFDVSKLSREEKLRAFMAIKKVTLVHLAKEMDISPNAVKYLLFNKTMPTRRHKELLDIGFPEDLLPPAEDRKMGPKPTEKCLSCVKDFSGFSVER